MSGKKERANEPIREARDVDLGTNAWPKSEKVIKSAAKLGRSRTRLHKLAERPEAVMKFDLAGRIPRRRFL